MHPAVFPLHSTKKIALIADDEDSNRAILTAVLNTLDYEVIQAENGAQAVTLYAERRPDLVLMDIMMPDTDGYAATIKIKQLAADQFVPVILLTAMTDDADLARCIEVGGDDFLTKPFSPTLLSAKVQSMERIQRLHKDVRTHYSRMQRDEEIAEKVFKGAVVAGNVALEHIHSVIRPASIFSGDILLTAFSPSRDLHVMLGDFTGHGLDAALGALPTSEVFRSMTAKGFSPQQILGAINNKLIHLLPTGMFLAVQFVKISHTLKYITAFNCGMPDCYLLDGETHDIKHTIPSKSLPLGISKELDLNEYVQHVRVDQNDRIILATDGITEARNQDGDYFGIDRFKQAITQSKGYAYVMEGVEITLTEFCQNAQQDDDISLAEIPLTSQLLPSWNAQRDYIKNEYKSLESEYEMETDSVEFNLTLRGNQLRRADPVPLLINYLQETVDLQEHQRHLFTILTELFANALDHGVLELGSELKEGMDGFSRYFEKREHLLQKSLAGYIRIGLRINPLVDGGFVVIQIEDSGRGFNYGNRKPNPVNAQAFSGRGIMLIENLCESFRYFPPGNKAEALYRWTKK